MQPLSLIKDRIIRSLTIVPHHLDWILIGTLLLAFITIVLPIGLQTHFLRFNPLDFTPTIFLHCFLITLITPAMFEELLYRVILIPHQSEEISSRNKLTWTIISLTIYILSHPLNGLTFYSAARSTFTSPVFLFFTTLLGIICTFAYSRTGSVWSSVIIHWLVVATWLMFFNGATQLNLL